MQRHRCEKAIAAQLDLHGSPSQGKAAKLREMDRVATVCYRSKPLFSENNYPKVDRRRTLKDSCCDRCECQQC